MIFLYYATYGLSVRVITFLKKYGQGNNHRKDHPLGVHLESAMDIAEIERMLKALIKSLENKPLNPWPLESLDPLLQPNWRRTKYIIDFHLKFEYKSIIMNSEFDTLHPFKVENRNSIIPGESYTFCTNFSLDRVNGQPIV